MISKARRAWAYGPEAAEPSAFLPTVAPTKT
jgi:hypothetical protein